MESLGCNDHPACVSRSLGLEEAAGPAIGVRSTTELCLITPDRCVNWYDPLGKPFDSIS